MDVVSKTVHINRLLDVYGRLLTKSQLEIMSDYYNCNLSLGEISSERGISRTAVQDAIKKATKKLEDYEKKLNLCGVFDSLKNKDNEKLLDEIEEGIKNGI